MSTSTLLLGLLLGLALGGLGAAVVIGRSARRQLALAVAEAERRAGDAARQVMALDAARAQSSLGERLVAREAELAQLRAQMEAAERERASLRRELLDLSGRAARLAAELEAEKSAVQGKVDLLEQAREALAHQFKALADQVLDEKTKRFSEQNRGELDLLLKPLGEKLQAFESKVNEVYVSEAKERHALAEEVKKLHAANVQISQDALNLTRALKGESKTRGNWGEVILERVLERSGLVKGSEYSTQVTLEGDAGRLRPDIVVHLPEGKHIVIDSKVSLVAYDRYHAAEDESVRHEALRDHLASLRRHVAELSDKAYQTRAGMNAPDFVALFVPIEPAYTLAAQNDESLYLDAFEKKVVIVTPGTLLAMLSTVATLWRREAQTKNALEIARRSGQLYDQFVLFAKALEDVGRHLGLAQDAYDKAQGRLARQRGNLVARAEALRKLGAQADKTLPSELVASAGIEDPGDVAAGDPSLPASDDDVSVAVGVTKALFSDPAE